MRDIKKVDWYYLDMQELAKITQEVYGKAYDVQMGEYSNGSYQTSSSDPEYQWGDFDGYYVDEEDHTSEYIFMTNEESVQRWIDTVPDSSNGRYISRDDENKNQPSLWVILQDLGRRGEIPIGDYFISIDW